MTFISAIILTISSTLIAISALAFLRTKDLFTMTHVVVIAHYYLLTIFFIGLLIKNFSLTIMVKLLVIIALNIIIATMLSNLILKQAVKNNVTADAEEIRGSS
jgi:multisubunit Na+/H+ antiporter MnhG subunit